MIYGYVRVSTEEQDNGPEVQRRGIDGTKLAVDEYFEDHVSGKSLKRDNLQRMLARVRKGDTVVVTKVDRLSRSVLDFAMLMDRADKEGWTLHVIELGIDMKSPMGKAMVQMMAVFAELERSLISQRVKDAMAVVKVNGTKSGKPIGHPITIPPDVVMRAKALRDKGMTLREIGAEVGIHFTSVGRLLR